MKSVRTVLRPIDSFSLEQIKRRGIKILPRPWSLNVLFQFIPTVPVPVSEVAP